MQNDNSDDPYGFWNDEPTRQLKRTHVGTRAHAETQMIPVVRHAETRMVPVVRMDRTRQIPDLHPRNPLVTRIAVMAGVTLLLIPLALSLRDDRSQVRTATIQGVDTILVGKLPSPAPTQATIAPATDAPTTTLAETTTVPPTPAPTEAAVVTPAPTEPPTTAAKKKTTPKSTTTVAPAAPAAAATQSADKAPCGLPYTVVKNDAWSTIASRSKVSMKSLLAANGATINTLLLPGKTICLPVGAVAPAPPATTAPVAKPPSTTAPATTQPKPAPTTPPATTSPPVTQPPPPANTYTRAQAAQIIRDVWPDDLEDEAIRIATRESNLIPTVRNSCCYGLFQIYYAAHRTWLAGMGITSAAQLYDPRVNATAALALYNNSGWAPWAISTPTTSVA